MAITDELREYANIATDRDIYAGARLCKIADRIDAEHRSALEKLAAQVDESERSGFDQGFASADDWLAQHEDAMAEHGWVRLPLDADGVPIRVGDIVEGEKVGGGFGEPFEVVGYILSNGELEPMDDHKFPRMRKYLHHHRAPTVEDVLREFAEKIIDSQIPSMHPTYEEAIAEYAEKLRLAGDAE